MPLITTRVTAATDATVKNAPLTNAEIDQNFININNALSVSADATGFVNRTNSTISFNDATRTLTLAPTGANFTMYYKGKSILISSAQTVQIANSNGGHWIHWDYNQARLVDLGNSPNIKDNLLVAYIYWDSTLSWALFFSDERHSAANDKQWHYSQHTTIGAIWKSGGDITCTLNNTNTVGFGLSSPIVLADEDLEHSITHSDIPSLAYEQSINSSLTALATVPVMYLNGATYTQANVGGTSLPWYPSTTRAYYNQVIDGSGSLVTAASDDLYIVYWLIATNDTRTPIKLVMGRNTWASYGEAETENFDSYGLPMPEIAPMYKFVLKTRSSYTQNLARVNLVAVRELLGKQNARSNSFDSLSHDALSDRFSADQHSIAAITNLQTTLDSINGATVAMAIALG
jgi:dihydrofolate reductase